MTKILSSVLVSFKTEFKLEKNPKKSPTLEKPPEKSLSGLYWISRVQTEVLFHQVFLKQCISYAEIFHVIKSILPLMFKVNLLQFSLHLVSNFLSSLKVLFKFHIAFLGLTERNRMVSKIHLKKVKRLTVSKQMLFS